MKLTTDRRLSIDQILSVFGEPSPHHDLHVYVQQLAVNQVPIAIPFRLDHYSIILVTNGTCEFQSDLITQVHRENDLIILTPHLINQFISVSQDYQFKLLSISPDFPMKLGVNQQHINSFSFFASQRPVSIMLNDMEKTSISMLIDLVQQKIKSLDHPFLEEVILHSFSLLMFEISALMKRHINRDRNQLSRQEELSLRFMNLLSKNIKTNRSIQFYASQLSVTSDYLTRVTKKTLYQSAGHIIDEMVIQESKIQLHNSTLSIAQVAEKLMFTDQFQFSRFFKKKTGINPSAFRKLGQVKS